ncbi:BnaA09g40920D [Brassica napus]|uniref:BnaA09g40920D protein n=1 Tax=Brassica napus TaxID=3708 RepID=A0A078FE64_BRANA|nr:BnaA09g40920D [Brassica napus]
MRKVSQISAVLRLASSSSKRSRHTNVCRSYCTPPNPTPSGPLTSYSKLVEQGRLQHDPYQEKVASAFQNLFGRLEHFEKEMEDYHQFNKRSTSCHVTLL